MPLEEAQLTEEVADLALGEAVARYMATLSAEEKAAAQPDLNRFMRWFGSQRPIGTLTPAEIENYAERISQSDVDYAKKLEIARLFLIAAKKQRWTKTNLATSLKLRKTRPRLRPAITQPKTATKVVLTPEGHAELKAELEALKIRRLELIEEIRRAAADKDFRENVPFHAAREQKGHVEGRIMELEETLKVAEITDSNSESSVRVNIGNTVVICDIATGEEHRYMLVSPREVDLSKGKISSVSPIGQALVGKSEGDTAEVIAPAGKLKFRIKRVE